MKTPWQIIRDVFLAEYSRLSGTSPGVDSRAWQIIEQCAFEAEKLLHGGLSYDECQQAAMNFGIDLRCGRCAGQFYTGSAARPHDAVCETRVSSLITAPTSNTARA